MKHLGTRLPRCLETPVAVESDYGACKLRVVGFVLIIICDSSRLSCPIPNPHCLDYAPRRDVIEIPRRRRDCLMPELLRNDPDIDALGPKFGGMGVS